MLLVGSFWRWLLQGGAALAIGAVAVYLAWSSAIDFNWWAWPRRYRCGESGFRPFNL
jgi:hypothetical protein